MKYPLALAALILAPALAQAPATILIPREKVSLSCQDTYFKSVRENFLLLDETYPTCTLKMPLALHERWPGVRTFYVIPRVSASLHSKNSKGEGKWQPPDGLIKEMRMPPPRGILMGYDNKKPDWRRRHYVIRPVVPLAEKSTVARPTSPHHDHLDAGWSDSLQIHSSSAVVLFSSLRKPDKRKARNGGSSAPSFSRRFQEQRSFKLF